MKRSLLCFCALTVGFFPLLAAPPSNKHKTSKNKKHLVRPITGKVTNASGAALVGVTVQVKGSNVFTASAEDGSFKIDVPDDATTLVFSYAGLGTVEELINGRSSINFQFRSDGSSMDEVVVIGYSTTKKSKSYRCRFYCYR